MAKKDNILGIIWPLVITTTIILYLLILVTVAFNTKTSTILLFALIAYWSRVPGVGMPSPFYILYRADVVDLFSLLIAVNIGAVQGAIFAVSINLWSRIAGVTPYWRGVLMDTTIHATVCLIIPLFYNFLDQNIFYTVIAYTSLHRIGFIIFHLIIPDMSNIEFVVEWIGAGAGIFLVNIIYGIYFGSFFDGLLKSGVEFNWVLFGIATLIIIFIKISLSEKKVNTNKSLITKFMDWIKLRIYLFVISIQNKSIRDPICSIFQNHITKQIDKKTLIKPKLKFVDLKFYKKYCEEYEEHSQIRNPEEVFIGFLESSNEENFLKGKNPIFFWRVYFIIIAMMVGVCVMNKHIPGFFEVLLSIILAVVIVVLFIWTIKNFVPWLMRLV